MIYRKLTVLAAEGRFIGSRISQDIRLSTTATVAQIRTAFSADGAALAVMQAFWRTVLNLGG